MGEEGGGQAPREGRLGMGGPVLVRITRLFLTAGRGSGGGIGGSSHVHASNCNQADKLRLQLQQAAKISPGFTTVPCRPPFITAICVWQAACSRLACIRRGASLAAPAGRCTVAAGRHPCLGALEGR